MKYSLGIFLIAGMLFSGCSDAKQNRQETTYKLLVEKQATLKKLQSSPENNYMLQKLAKVITSLESKGPQEEPVLIFCIWNKDFSTPREALYILYLDGDLQVNGFILKANDLEKEYRVLKKPPMDSIYAASSYRMISIPIQIDNVAPCKILPQYLKEFITIPKEMAAEKVSLQLLTKDGRKTPPVEIFIREKAASR